MKKTWLASTLMVLFASSAMAETKIWFANRSNHSLYVTTYDWDDAVRQTPSSTKTIGAGASSFVTCRKSLTEANGPGCFVEVRLSDGKPKVSGWNLEVGSYMFRATWETTPYGLRIVSGPTLSPMYVDETVLQKSQLPNPSGGTSECIYKGTEAVLLSNGLATLKWQFDGNLVLFDAQGAQWGAGTNPDGARVCFQGDGNLVIYRKDHDSWATGTDGTGATLQLQRDCNVVILDSNGATVWQTGTYCRN